MDLIQTKYLQYQLLGDHQKHLVHNLDFAGVRGECNRPYLLSQTNTDYGDQTSLRSRFAPAVMLRFSYSSSIRPGNLNLVNY